MIGSSSSRSSRLVPEPLLPSTTSIKNTSAGARKEKNPLAPSRQTNNPFPPVLFCAPHLSAHQHSRAVAARHDPRGGREKQRQERPERRRVSGVRVDLVVGAPVVEPDGLFGGQISGERAQREEQKPQHDAADGRQREEQEHGGRGVHVPVAIRNEEDE